MISQGVRAEPPKKRLWLRLVGLLITAAIAATLFTFPKLFPQFDDLWRGFGVVVPPFTKAVMSIYLQLRHVVLSLIALHVSLSLLYLFVPGRFAKTFWLVSLLNIVLALTTLLALYAPLIGAGP